MITFNVVSLLKKAASQEAVSFDQTALMLFL